LRARSVLGGKKNCGVKKKADGAFALLKKKCAINWSDAHGWAGGTGGKKTKGEKGKEKTPRRNKTKGGGTQ